MQERQEPQMRPHMRDILEERAYQEHLRFEGHRQPCRSNLLYLFRV